MMIMTVATSLTATTSDWEQYKQHYKKHYKDKGDEEARRQLFEASKTRIAGLNKLNREQGLGDAFGINWSSDREFRPRGGKPLHRASPSLLPIPNEALSPCTKLALQS